jgi:hypothetical protein
MIRRLVQRVWAYIRPMYLMVSTVDSHTDRIELQDGNSAEQELDLFLKRQGRYEDGWVPLGKPGVTQTFMRYERIAWVKIVPKD